MEERLLTADLYEYLVALASQLENLRVADAARQVLHVSKFASGSTSELYGEARLLLPRILQKHGGSLSEMDRVRLCEIIAGIEDAFGRIGGG